jgi:hypothetical protein
MREFFWFDHCHRLVAAQEYTPDPVLRALPACPHLRKVTIWSEHASADAMKNLLQLPSATHLHLLLEMEHWLAVADEIRRGHCNVLQLTLSMCSVTISETMDAVKAAASAIQMDHNLEHLTLAIEGGFTDEACVALAEALTVNKTLCKIIFSKATTLGAQGYEAFGAML